MSECQVSHEVIFTQDTVLIRFHVEDDQEVLFEQTVDGNCEDALISTANEMAQATQIDLAQVEQTMAQIVTRARHEWLLSRQGVGGGGGGGGEVVSEPAVEPQDRYLSLTGDAARSCGEQVTGGIWDASKERFLSNFVLTIDQDVEVQDDIESSRVFHGRLVMAGRGSDFQIPSKDFADNNKLKAALFATGGPQVLINAGMDELRRAVTTISNRSGTISRRVVTTNFGWDKDGVEYRFPGGSIRDGGFVPVDVVTGVDVDLAKEDLACHLGLKVLSPEELVRVKRQVVEDLLPLHERPVTYSLLGATALAVLMRFAEGYGRPALWLTGLTGNGKSYAAKLFANFFGDFPVGGVNRVATWTATPNYVQRQGSFFKDALYLVDDYKPENTLAYQVTRVLQNYADGTGRGRLRADATTNVTRPIRGLLVSTGEDIPEHSASVVARCIVVPVPQRKKDLERGKRCVAECHNYGGVTADFVRWLLAEKRIAVFSERLNQWQERYYTMVVGQQNDSRIASNFALLAAAFEQFAAYLGEVWPGWEKEVRRFTEEDLVGLMRDMLIEVKEQQASEVFMSTLAELIRHGQVRLEGYGAQGAENKPIIGRVPPCRHPVGLELGRPSGEVWEISTTLARGAVNESLRKQGRSPLQVTDKALREQLRQDGWLLGPEGQVLGTDGAELGQRARIGGKQVRCLVVSRRRLLEEDN
jgi:hypothetical protein